MVQSDVYHCTGQNARRRVRAKEFLVAPKRILSVTLQLCQRLCASVGKRSPPRRKLSTALPAFSEKSRLSFLLFIVFAEKHLREFALILTICLIMVL